VDELPIIDVGPLVTGAGDVPAVAAALDAACREHGFFYVVGHGVPEALQAALEEQARALFALPDAAKQRVAMEHGGIAWRGWFPLEGELTSGQADRKEGYYLGAELGADDARVRAATPLHGPNLFPAELPDLRPVVLAYLDAMTDLGHALIRGLALGLGLDDEWFARHLTGDPLVLFRLFRYPPEPPDEAAGWGVGEHTDYGLLTILAQDATAGLEVHAPGGWIDAPPVPGSFVCNLGDMLERMTGGRYRSTPHRVRNTSGVDRLSFPFFFDPAWDATVVPVPGLGDDPLPDHRPRWDGEDLFDVEGTYGDYLLTKVGRVFPALRDAVLAPPQGRPRS
jgi:isopenicillin N synthase-like dioxygenase